MFCSSNDFKEKKIEKLFEITKKEIASYSNILLRHLNNEQKNISYNLIFDVNYKINSATRKILDINEKNFRYFRNVSI